MACLIHTTPQPRFCNDCERAQPTVIVVQRDSTKLILLPSDRAKYQIIRHANSVEVIHKCSS